MQYKSELVNKILKMSDLTERKVENINFRIEQDLKEQVIEMAKAENMNLSTFMKKVLLEYPELAETSRRFEKNNSIRKQAVELSESLRKKLDSYRAPEFDKVFSQVRGKEFRGRQIKRESDLLKILCEELNLKIEDHNVQLSVNEIVVQNEKKRKINVALVVITLVVLITVAVLIVMRRK